MAVVNLTQDNFESLLDQKSIIIMDFWAKWCEPCKSFAPIFAKVSDNYPDVCFASVDIEQQQELADAFHIRSVPLIVVIKNEVVVFSESGTMPETALVELVEKALALDDKTIEQSVKKG